MNLSDIPCVGLDKYHFDAASYTETVTFYAEGRAPFKVRCVPESLYHGSIFAHIAEIDIKTRFWRGFKPGDCVLDAGHGFGAYSLPPAALGAEVWAIDPEGLDGDYVGFRLTCEANDMFGGRMHIRRAFLGSHIGCDHRCDRLHADDKPHVITIDSLDRPFTHINLDTEGAEPDILLGAVETLRKHKPKIILEDHLFVRATVADECATFLKQFGYVLKGRIPEGECTHSYYECEL